MILIWVLFFVFGSMTTTIMKGLKQKG